MKTTTNIIASFIIVPLLASTLSMNTFTVAISAAVAKATAADAPSAAELALQADREAKAAKIDAYYAQYDLPLAGHGMQMVLVAEKYGLDYRLLPAIAMRESTGCKFIVQSKQNCFGYGTQSFKSFDDGIEAVGRSLGGANPSTAKYYAPEKTLTQKLKAYNNVIPTYTTEVLGIMTKIDKIEA